MKLPHISSIEEKEEIQPELLSDESDIEIDKYCFVYLFDSFDHGIRCLWM